MKLLLVVSSLCVTLGFMAGYETRGVRAHRELEAANLASGQTIFECAEDLERCASERETCCTTCMDVCSKCEGARGDD